ncbi:glycosyltransferase family 4 protein [Chloroflexota bacterium]
MRICYLASPSIHTHRWIKYFADNGHEVHLITSAKPSADILGNVKLHVLSRVGPQTRIVNYLINSVPMVIQFRKMIKDINPDILHAHCIMETTLLGTTSGFHPLVITTWGSDVLIAPQQSKASRWLAEYVLKRADLITCDAEHIKEPLAKLGADPKKINLIYHGVDTRKFNPGRRDERFVKELGIVGSPTVISLRRFEPIYNVETLITAIPMVLRDVPGAKFLLVEKGSQENKLKDLAQSLGVSDSVKFVGWVPEDELPRYLASADVYVSTSLSDAGLAASTAEAMACGLPVVITDFGDNRKWVEDGVNGFIIPLKAPEVLAAKIVQLLRDEATRKRFGGINQQIIMARNNWEVEMEKMGKLYQELVERYKGQGDE